KDEASKTEEDTEQAASVVNHCIKSKDANASVHISRKHESQVILSTALVYVKNNKGKRIVCRALLDPGAQSNLITVALSQKLKLSYTNGSVPVSGVCKIKTEAKRTRLHIESMHSEFVAELECLVLPTITTKLPQVNINTEKILIPTDTLLADPTYGELGDIDLLIGAGLYWKIVIGSPRNCINNQPALQNTRPGWIIGGETSEEILKSASTCLTITNPQLAQQLKKFWKQETLPEVQHYTKEEKLCERHFSETVQRDSSGRFIVRLPTCPNIRLGQSRDQAQRRL
ncbi:PREDICTED: uncharacterized protein LOC105460853, partial [Wasmannia auropunctata]|uniref:uncharacterized protein LOC105460853 n=1 Tax=Wasmannia auropunctata TaxID=64793 RepID=UPI0005EF4556